MSSKLAWMLLPETLQNRDCEGMLLSWLNGRLALANMDRRAQYLDQIMQSNIVLAAKAIAKCYRPQENERLGVIELAVQQAAEFEQPILVAESIIALSKLGEMEYVQECYVKLQQLSSKIKRELTPIYRDLLLANGYQSEQTTLFNMLIGLATNYKEAEEYFNDMQLQQVQATNLTFTLVLRYCRSSLEVQKWLISMENNGILVNSNNGWLAFM
jgi:hypothetical protein